MGSPLLAATANPAPSTGSGEDFGQYLADHQDDLAPFFSKNAGNLLKQAIPRLMELGSWVIIVTMLLGWFVDVLLSRGFSALFAPAFADMKRAMIYATGQFVLSFIYTAMIALALIFTLSFSHYEIIVTCAIVFLVVVALAAQLAWILYLYRADVPVSAGFYLILVLVHIVVAGLISGPLVGSQAVGVTRDFIAGVITRRQGLVRQRVLKPLTCRIRSPRRQRTKINYAGRSRPKRILISTFSAASSRFARMETWRRRVIKSPLSWRNFSRVRSMPPRERNWTKSTAS
jgi:hypothetical protein